MVSQWPHTTSRGRHVVVKEEKHEDAKWSELGSFDPWCFSSTGWPGASRLWAGLVLLPYGLAWCFSSRGCYDSIQSQAEKTGSVIEQN